MVGSVESSPTLIFGTLRYSKPSQLTCYVHTRNATFTAQRQQSTSDGSDERHDSHATVTAIGSHDGDVTATTEMAMESVTATAAATAVMVGMMATAMESTAATRRQ